ncbi:hypothetical protein RJ639_007250 [Escallonia herrerae]|uniref:Phospholipase D n=1 Tax=Escallonia herrerae TaxID=1293975 RepID=A0AA88VU16_9ASTE|nr:hypothetical protein RJ639_007250 [Escallonia herrerae]
MAEIAPPEPGPIYLHGDLDLKIIEARDLPNMDMVSERLRRCFTVFDACRPPSSGGGGGSQKVKHHHKVITSDPYVTVGVPQATVARTRVLPNSQNPRWNESFHIPLAHPVVYLEFQVKDDDVFGAQVIGTALIPAARIATGELISGWFPVLAASGKPPKPDTALKVELKFTPCDENELYEHGIAGDPAHLGVRHTYFPLRKGCAVTLYQDAHIGHAVKLPKIELDGGRSLTIVKLVREPTRPLPRGGDLMLGELLKYKSEEGVRVLLLVWDDKTSHDKLLLSTGGVMQTHDEETRKFFKHSSVICVLSPRYASSKLGLIKQQAGDFLMASNWIAIRGPNQLLVVPWEIFVLHVMVVGTMFTHHQKCVLVDTQASGNNRKITAFVGGLDLCDGRYDTPEHRLFRDLDPVFKDDFHNPTFPAGTKAPRQPWHDLHSKIDGPAAYDVLINFEQRWKKATKWSEFRLLLKKKISHWHDDAMIKIERISWILSPPSFGPKEDYTEIPQDDPALYVSREDHPEHWHVQIFRSIDSGSGKGFPKTVNVAASQNLICSKNLVIDKSIQTAYIQAIRSAQHFIYIENQYFIGSSYAWPSYKDAGADNLIPMELALKIASKIRAKERFAVYVVIPMWPEGDPTSATVQEILFWQSQTMQMMYAVVARELKSMQLPDSHPCDYLNFYCLGKREERPREISQSAGDADKVSSAWKSQRFMIYVHAKGMVVDDEYVIIGSANINQRSLAGTKDTEIAMGAYQPHLTWAEKGQHPHGQIYGYRMSLWAEHLGMSDKHLKEPENLECVKRVNKVAEENWNSYTAENFTPLKGHLLKYPLDVDVDGKVGPLPGHENFPDVGGKILGAPSPTLPDILTT